jgi:hypothetical protein
MMSTLCVAFIDAGEPQFVRRQTLASRPAWCSSNGPLLRSLARSTCLAGDASARPATMAASSGAERDAMLAGRRWTCWASAVS